MPFLNCPACDFSREIEAERIKPGPLKVRCPKCQTSFEVQGEELLSNAAGQTTAGGGTDPSLELELDWSGRQTPEQRAAASAESGAFALPAVATFRPVYAPPPSAMAAMVIPAAYGARVVAALVDAVMVSAALKLLRIAVEGILGSRLHNLQGDQLVQLTATFAVLAFCVNTAWYVIPTAIWGKTLGKRLMGLSVVASDGELPGLLQVLFREVVGKFLSGLFCGLGYLLPIFDERGRALHDRVARTMVVKD